MRTFKLVTAPDPAVVEYLRRYEHRLGNEAPMAIFVARHEHVPEIEGPTPREEPEVLGALIVWPRSVFAVSVILPSSEEKETERPFMVLLRLIAEFERWALSKGARCYAFSVHESEEPYLKIVNKFAEPISERNERGYRTFIRPLIAPLPKETF